MQSEYEPKVDIGIWETQPLMVEGLRKLASDSGVYNLLDPVRTFEEAVRLAVRATPRLMIVDKSLGVSTVLEWLSQTRGNGPATVVWGNLMNEPEALRLLKAGAKGIIRKTAPTETLLACFDAVVNGNTWMEDALFREHMRQEKQQGSGLTLREQQVFELVEQGLRNKDIAQQLGIRPGTVKIHLKHIFEKTGIRGRYGLALSGFKAKAIIPVLHV